MVSDTVMTMTNAQAIDHAAVIEAAARSLVSVDHGDSVSRVSLPIFYPSGAAATVEIIHHSNRYHVTDFGLAYREAEMVGGELYFRRNAEAIAQQFAIDVGKRGFSTSASVDELAGAIADVGAASVQVAHRICERVAQQSEAAIATQLYDRLVTVFGAQKVERDAEIVGASSHKWKLSAVVHVGGKDVAFETVSNHHASVYSSATMFHDLALLDRKPVPVAVVRNKQDFGAYLSILAQAANVVEESIPNAALERLAA